MNSFICRGCLSPVTSTGCTSVDIGASANLELVDRFCWCSCGGQNSNWMEWIQAVSTIAYQYGYIINYEVVAMV